MNPHFLTPRWRRSLAGLAIAAVGAMAFAGRRAQGRGMSKGVVTHLTLLVGCFGSAAGQE